MLLVAPGLHNALINFSAQVVKAAQPSEAVLRTQPPDLRSSHQFLWTCKDCGHDVCFQPPAAARVRTESKKESLNVVKEQKHPHTFQPHLLEETP